MKNVKILKGYVENRTKEAALAAMFLALFLVNRYIRIEFFLLSLNFAWAFGHTAIIILSWPYSFLFSLGSTITSSTPLKSLIATLPACQVTFFSSKLLKGKWRILSAAFGSLTGNFISAYYLYLVGKVPLEIGLPISFVKACLSILPVLVLAPSIYKMLEKMGVMDWAQ